MLDEIEIGCATTNSKYKERLDCAVVKIPKSSTLSGVFTTNNFKLSLIHISEPTRP